MKQFKTILATTIFSIILLSCSNVNNKPPKIVSTAFTYLTTHVLVQVCGDTNGHGYRCLDMDPKRFSASGSVIRHQKNNSYILTAAHFCTIDEGQVISSAVNPALIEATFKDVKDVKLRLLIEVLDGNDVTRIGKVVASNLLLDVCILETDRIDTQALKLAPSPPKYGEDLWNMASPLGIIMPGTAPILKGVFSGSVKMGSRTSYVITDLPAIHGCSGSPLLNYRGELVGMIYSTNQYFHEMSFAVRLEDIRKYLDKVFIDDKHISNGNTTLEVIEPDYGE